MNLINNEKKYFGWIDLGKGLSIFLVVLLHSSHVLHAEFNADSLIFFLSDNTRSLRMPLFFLISGILSTFLMKKVFYFTFKRCFNLYFAMLFWGIFSLFGSILLNGDGDLSTSHRILIAFLGPTYWYLWALIIYTVTLKLFFELGEYARYALIPISIILAFGAVDIGVYSEEVTSKAVNGYALEMVALNFLWFVSGALFKDVIIKLSSVEFSKSKLIALFSSASLILLLWGTRPEQTAIFLVSCCAWLTLSIFLLPTLESFKISNLFIILGRHTLIIYVTHQHFLTVFKRALAYVGYEGQSVLLNDSIAILFALASIICAITAEKVIRFCKLGFLVDGPLKKNLKS